MVDTDTANITITITGVNDTPTAVNDFGVVTEDSTITITNGESGNLSGSYDTHDEHSGDILSNDTDPDASPTHTITAIRNRFYRRITKMFVAKQQEQLDLH